LSTYHIYLLTLCVIGYQELLNIVLSYLEINIRLVLHFSNQKNEEIIKVRWSYIFSFIPSQKQKQARPSYLHTYVTKKREGAWQHNTLTTCMGLDRVVSSDLLRQTTTPDLVSHSSSHNVLTLHSLTFKHTHAHVHTNQQSWLQNPEPTPYIYKNDQRIQASNLQCIHNHSSELLAQWRISTTSRVAPINANLPHQNPSALCLSLSSLVLIYPSLTKTNHTIV
jgi:hypothetical protein